MDRKSELLGQFISNELTAEQLVEMIVALELEVEKYKDIEESCECDRY